ncbi:MAG TPA: type I-D CRISPR-associated protein Cas7/Csc2 [Ktedonobacteraceae bacterium]|nr:type I-D CRISPR-associated protein Cas7/Csc2 [Ktedonobacteraceae bacterium]
MASQALFQALSKYQQYLLPKYSNFPLGQYVTLFIVRKTQSETIFRTEGSGSSEGLVKEEVFAGLEHLERIRRVVISKRKQTAVERRTGREVLRAHDLLKKDSKDNICALNTNAPCGQCIDCKLYGYAVGTGGAQKSRVITDDAFSIGPVGQVTGSHTFNATFDTGTMTNPLTKKPSSSINTDEYVRPETHFLDMETLKDVTIGELQYVIGVVLRSQRYGAITSRLGKVRNTLTALVFSDTELFSNLELTQAVYDRLIQGKEELDFPLAEKDVLLAVEESTNSLLNRVASRTPVVVRGAALKPIIDETINLYRESDTVQSFLERIENDYR